MLNLYAKCLHKFGTSLSSFAMWADPSEGREHIKPSRVWMQVFNFGGWCEGTADTIFWRNKS